MFRDWRREGRDTTMALAVLEREICLSVIPSLRYVTVLATGSRSKNAY